jgi:hypothetical protein
MIAPLAGGNVSSVDSSSVVIPTPAAALTSNADQAVIPPASVKNGDASPLESVSAVPRALRTEKPSTSYRSTGEKHEHDPEMNPVTSLLPLSDKAPVALESAVFAWRDAAPVVSIASEEKERLEMAVLTDLPTQSCPIEYETTVVVDEQNGKDSQEPPTTILEHEQPLVASEQLTLGETRGSGIPSKYSAVRVDAPVDLSSVAEDLQYPAAVGKREISESPTTPILPGALPRSFAARHVNFASPLVSLDTAEASSIEASMPGRGIRQGEAFVTSTELALSRGPGEGEKLRSVADPSGLSTSPAISSTSMAGA